MGGLPVAATSYSPSPAIRDGVTFKEAVAKFAETGHPIPLNTLKRIAHTRGFKTERVGRTDYVSYSNLLEAHAEWVRTRDA